MTKRAQAAWSQRGSRIAGILEGHFGIPLRSGKRSSPLNTLIATMLSQNTNDQNSYRAWLSMRKSFPTWEKVASAPWQALASSIKVGGLKNQKALRIKKILRLIHGETGKYDLGFLNDRSNDEVMEYLLSMKGVGKKTAACVLVFSLGRDVFPVDTHIHRICNRLGLVRTNSADRTFDAMKDLVPKGRAYSFHVNLIRFGRETCKANKPLCGTCPLFDECMVPENQRCAAGTNIVRGVSNKRRDFLITEQIVRDRAG